MNKQLLNEHRLRTSNRLVVFFAILLVALFYRSIFMLIDWDKPHLLELRE